MTILEEIKTMLEVELGEGIFDDQLLLHINAGISYLRNNKIPVTKIDKTTQTSDFDMDEFDELIVIDWLSLYCLQRFDRSLLSAAAGTTANWIATEMTNLIYQLKTKYDSGGDSS